METNYVAIRQIPGESPQFGTARLVKSLPNGELIVDFMPNGDAMMLGSKIYPALHRKADATANHSNDRVWFLADAEVDLLKSLKPPVPVIHPEPIRIIDHLTRGRGGVGE